jgi:hypothetical protein
MAPSLEAMSDDFLRVVGLLNFQSWHSTINPYVVHFLFRGMVLRNLTQTLTRLPNCQATRSCSTVLTRPHPPDVLSFSEQQETSR